MDNQQPSNNYKPLKEDNDYLIYDDGRVFSKKTDKFLTGKIDGAGYRVYALAIKDDLADTKKKSKMFYAHRLVAQYFIPNPQNKPCVNHKDENKLNDNVTNLEWVTEKQNTQKHNLLNPGSRKNIKKLKYYQKDLQGEEWRIIPFNVNYSISNKGRVRNNRTNRLLHYDEKSNSYYRIGLYNGQKSIHYYIHRLVYCVFHNDYDLQGFVIDHIDANRHNNNLENLQKITQSENNLKQACFNK